MFGLAVVPPLAHSFPLPPALCQGPCPAPGPRCPSRLQHHRASNATCGVAQGSGQKALVATWTAVSGGAHIHLRHPTATGPHAPCPVPPRPARPGLGSSSTGSQEQPRRCRCGRTLAHFPPAAMAPPTGHVVPQKQRRAASQLGLPPAAAPVRCGSRHITSRRRSRHPLRVPPGCPAELPLTAAWSAWPA